MKRRGIGTLILLGAFLIWTKAALANLAASSAPSDTGTYWTDDRVPMEQLVLNIGAIGTAAQETDADVPIVGYFLEAKPAQDVSDAASALAAFNSNASISNWIIALAIDHRTKTQGILDDATGRHGLLDSGGTVVTLNDPRRGGAAITIGINSSGQIVGNVYGRTHARGLSPKYNIADVPAPNPLPFLAGCLPIIVIASWRKRKR